MAAPAARGPPIARGAPGRRSSRRPRSAGQGPPGARARSARGPSGACHPPARGLRCAATLRVPCRPRQRRDVLDARSVAAALACTRTRAVQKLIESLRIREEISLVIDALRPGFLELIMDPNANHVVQKCLQSFEDDDNKAIFDAAALHHLDIGMQCHGCCVLERCIARSRGEHRDKLVAAIACNGFKLAQDAYGNYVVHYVNENC